MFHCFLSHCLDMLQVTFRAVLSKGWDTLRGRKEGKYGEHLAATQVMPLEVCPAWKSQLANDSSVTCSWQRLTGRALILLHHSAASDLRTKSKTTCHPSAHQKEKLTPPQTDPLMTPQCVKVLRAAFTTFTQLKGTSRASSQSRCTDDFVLSVMDVVA
jgi:hypothetical protein